MILSFKIENFRSIKDRITVDFTESSRKDDSQLIHNSFKVNDSSVLSSIILYGRNASGKSNILMAIQAMSFLVLKSDTFKHGDPLAPYEPFKFDTQSATQPILLEIEFISRDSDIKFIYSILYSRSEIVKESLFFYPQGVRAKLYERKKGKFSYGDYYKGAKKEHRIKSS